MSSRLVWPTTLAGEAVGGEEGGGREALCVQRLGGHYGLTALLAIGSLHHVEGAALPPAAANDGVDAHATANAEAALAAADAGAVGDEGHRCRARFDDAGLANKVAASRVEQALGQPALASGPLVRGGQAIQKREEGSEDRRVEASPGVKAQQHAVEQLAVPAENRRGSGSGGPQGMKAPGEACGPGGFGLAL